MIMMMVRVVRVTTAMIALKVALVTASSNC